MEFREICPVSDIPEGTRAVFDVDGRWVAIFCVSARYYAIEDVCTHDGNVLSEDARGNPVPLDGYEIECPRHGARFDIRDGKVLSAPAYQAVRWYPTEIRDDTLFLGVGR